MNKVRKLAIPKKSFQVFFLMVAICVAISIVFKIAIPYSIALNQKAKILIDLNLDKYINYDLSKIEAKASESAVNSGSETGNSEIGVNSENETGNSEIVGNFGSETNTQNAKGTLLQYTIKTGVEYEDGSEYYPMNNNQINVELGEIDGKVPTSVNVVTKSTKATNGSKFGERVTYNYDSSNGKLSIVTSNLDDSGNNIKNERDSLSRDEYIIICDYDTYTDKEDARKAYIKVSEEEDFKADVTTKLTSDTELNQDVSSNFGDLISTSYDTNDIYNGYIKSNLINKTTYDTDYKDDLEILVSKKLSQGKMEVAENNAFVKVNSSEKKINENVETGVDNNGNLAYVSSKIYKANVQSVLGEDWEIQILDEKDNELAKINKDSEFGDDGSFTVNYPEGIENIKINTSDVKNEGFIKIENVKVLKNTLTDVGNLKIKTATKLNFLSQNVETDTTTNVYSVSQERKLDINEAKTDVTLNLSSSNWTNKQQNDVDFILDLNSENETKNLFNNPTFKITVPKEVEKVILGDAIISQGNGLNIASVTAEANASGNYVITANVSGKQAQYVQNNLGVTTQIKIPATIILKKDIENVNSSVGMLYTNSFDLTGEIETGNKETAVSLEDYMDGLANVESQASIENEQNKQDAGISGQTVNGQNSGISAQTVNGQKRWNI